MGREIRRVPIDWRHPTYADLGLTYPYAGRADEVVHPLYDRDYATACAAWKAGLTRWEAGEDPDREAYRRDDGSPYEWWDWHGNPPDPEYHRARVWAPEEATAYQVYETVTEGTPVSPVFATLDELRAWLVRAQGMSEAGADQFIAWGSVPSMLVGPGIGLRSNFEVAEPLPGEERDPMTADDARLVRAAEAAGWRFSLWPAARRDTGYGGNACRGNTCVSYGGRDALDLLVQLARHALMDRLDDPGDWADTSF